MSAFNGSGTFVISGTGLPFVTGTTISSTVANQLNTDLATGLSTCITKDGQTTITANLPMGGFKHTGAAVATGTGQYVVYNQWIGGNTPGTTTNDNATAGNIGEYISSDVPQTSSVSLTTGVAKTVTSISLTAGDWDVSCVGKIELSGGPTCQNLLVSISTTNNTQDFTLGRGIQLNQAVISAAVTPAGCIPSRRFSLASTTTIYLVALASFTTGAASGYGNLSARRVR